MSSKENPSGSHGRTVVQNAGPVRAGEADGAAPRAKPANATMIYDGPLQAPPANWRSGTVIFDDKSAGDDGDWQASPPPGSNNAAARPGKMSLDALLSAGEGMSFASTNPYLAAAAPLLLLIGRLRQATVAAEPGPLAAHIADAIREFERRLGEIDLLPADVRIAKYALCETADDIVQNLPGADPNKWKPYSMLSQFFQTSAAGTGFFAALNKVLTNPEAHEDLLELMHACLSLGFEGQYRGKENRETLDRVRQDVYETLRYFKARPAEDISPRWQGLSEAMAKTRARIPLWALAAGAIALVTGAFFLMRMTITDEGDTLADRLLALSPAAPMVIERVAAAPEPVVVEEPKPVTSQLERIRTALASDIGGGNLTVEQKGGFIVVEINNLLLFASGRAEIKQEFGPVAERIATVLGAERGPITIIGHTDNVKPRKSSAFKSNYDLSVARAKAVEAVVAPKIADPSRLAVDGKGEDEPIADNSTAEGRTRNRRVDLMIPREETL